MDTTTGKLCAATARAGSPCRVLALAGSDYCYWHDPSLATKRKEARVKINDLPPWERLALRLFYQAVRDAQGGDEKNRREAILFLQSPAALELADLLGYSLPAYKAGVEVLRVGGWARLHRVRKVATLHNLF